MSEEKLNRKAVSFCGLLLLSLFLFSYSRRVHLSYPWILYFNQLINAAVKVYCIFRLSKQRWTNRGNQSAGMSGASLTEVARDTMASWCTATAVALLVVVTMHYAGLSEIPSRALFQSLLLG